MMILFFNWQVAIYFALPLEFIHPPTTPTPQQIWTKYLLLFFQMNLDNPMFIASFCDYTFPSPAMPQLNLPNFIPLQIINSPFFFANVNSTWFKLQALRVNPKKIWMNVVVYCWRCEVILNY